MKKLMSLLMIVMLTLSSAPAYAQLSEVSVGASQTQEIDRHGICKVVKNLNPTNALYVPSMSRDEWINFLSVPPWREVSECLACSGYARDGYCFYAAKLWAVAGDAAYQTCDMACASRGGVDPAGMNKLIGLPATAAISEPASNLWGGELMLAGGGGYVPNPPGYCQTITNALIGHSNGQKVLNISQANAGCSYAWFSKSATYGEIVVGTGWRNMAPAAIGSCTHSQAICACNR